MVGGRIGMALVMITETGIQRQIANAAPFGECIWGIQWNRHFLLPSCDQFCAVFGWTTGGDWLVGWCVDNSIRNLMLSVIMKLSIDLLEFHSGQ